MNHIEKQKIKEIENIQGTTTSLISLYVPADKNISAIKTRMYQEKSEAQNIKSDSNRKNVETAIDLINKLLKNYKQTPENGLILFAGVNKNDDKVEYVFDDLESKLNHSEYKCDNKFYVEKLKEHILPSESIGLLVIERGGTVIGELKGTSITIHHNEESSIMGKHKAGGQSSERFRRLIEQQKDDFFLKIRNRLKKLFIDENNQPKISGIVIGGTKITAEKFVSNNFLPKPLENIQIGKIYPIDIATEEALNELVTKAQPAIDTIISQEEKKTLNLFFEYIRREDKYTAYGEETIKKAIEYGAVDKLLITENHSIDKIQEYQKKVSEKGGKVFVIPLDFSQSEQFKNGFNGIGAILRYQIE